MKKSGLFSDIVSVLVAHLFRSLKCRVLGQVNICDDGGAISPLYLTH